MKKQLNAQDILDIVEKEDKEKQEIDWDKLNKKVYKNTEKRKK